MNKIVIIGAGQYGMHVRDILLSNGLYDDIAFADDNSDSANYTIDSAIALTNVDYCIAIGNAQAREQIYNKIKSMGKKVCTIIHKSAYVANSAHVEEGCIIEPNVSIGANVQIGKACIVCLNAIVNHNSNIGDYSQIDVGAIVTARAKVPSKQKIEAGQKYV